MSRKYKLWILDNCYRKFYTDTKNSITHANKINYPIGQLYSLEFEFKKNNQMSSFSFLPIYFYRFKFINNLYFNYKLKNEIKLSKLFKFLFIFMGFIFFVKDILFFNINKEKFFYNKNKPIKIK